MSDILRRRLKGGFREFEILSEGEGRERGLQDIPWRVGQPGQWVKTDDGYFCQCLDRKTFHKRKTPQDLVILSFCRQWVGPMPLNYLAYKTAQSWGASSPTTWVVYESRKKRTKTMVKVFVHMMLNHTIDYHRLGIVYRPDQRIPAATVRRLLKEEVIKKMVDDELSKVLSNKGITKESVLDMYLKAASIAEHNEKAGELRAIAADLAEILDMKPKAQKYLGDGGMSEDVGKQIEAGMAEFTVVQKQIVSKPDIQDAVFEVLPDEPKTS